MPQSADDDLVLVPTVPDDSSTDSNDCWSREGVRLILESHDWMFAVHLARYQAAGPAGRDYHGAYFGRNSRRIDRPLRQLWEYEVDQSQHLPPPISSLAMP